MADPGVLGINAGAGLLVAAFIVFVPVGLVPSTVALPWRLSVSVKARRLPSGAPDEEGHAHDGEDDADGHLARGDEGAGRPPGTGGGGPPGPRPGGA